MKFPLHHIVDYAVKIPAKFEKAEKEFFRGVLVEEESLRELFVE